MPSSLVYISAAWEALGHVLDPETELSVVEMGLVYGVEETANGLRVLMTLTHPSCPMGGLIVEQAEAAPADPECATRTELTFDPPWTLDHIAFRGRHELG